MSNAAQKQHEPNTQGDSVAFDENTFFLVIDEGEEDGRLRNEVNRRCKGVNGGKIINVLPLMNLSERHKVVLVFRPHVPGERDMKKWPVKLAGPVKAADFWNDVTGLNQKKFINACGSEMVPATPRIKDEPGLGVTMRIHYA